jgi:hypothetical protein
LPTHIKTVEKDKEGVETVGEKALSKEIVSGLKKEFSKID